MRWWTAFNRQSRSPADECESGMNSKQDVHSVIANGVYQRRLDFEGGAIRALEVMAHVLVRDIGDADLGDRLLDIFIEREGLQSTGIGEGVATPHCKVAGVDRLLFGAFFFDPPVDFNAIDKVPTDLFFAVVVPEQTGGAHLKLLARCSRILRNPSLRAGLRGAKTSSEMRRLVVDESLKI